MAHLAVLPGRQGQGLGSALLHRAEARAGLHGCRRVALTVEMGNDRACAF